MYCTQFALVVLFCIGSSLGQTVPTVWPQQWHTWVVTSVKVANATDPQYNQGRLIMFDGINQVACRYWEQNLVNLSTTRQADYCDYSVAKHYIMSDTKADSVCSSIVPINGTLSRLAYPPDFVSTAKFLGVNHVGQLDCNHFFAPAIKLSDGQYVQMDVWTDVGLGLPCQISTLNIKTNEITTWAFDGFALAIPHQAIQQCSIPKIMCAEPDWVCHAKRTADPGVLGSALGWTCSDGKIDCTPINPGGDHYYPNTLMDHCDWAFNQYYLQHRYNQGIDACDFGGVGEIVPPSPTPTPTPTPGTTKQFLPREQSRDVMKFLKAMTGSSASVYPYDLVCINQA